MVSAQSMLMPILLCLGTSRNLCEAFYSLEGGGKFLGSVLPPLLYSSKPFLSVSCGHHYFFSIKSVGLLHLASLLRTSAVLAPVSHNLALVPMQYF